MTATETENFPVMRALRDVELTKADMAFVNGKLMGSSKTPPFRVQVDVGDAHVPREFNAVAYTASGASAVIRSAGSFRALSLAKMGSVRMVAAPPTTKPAGTESSCERYPSPV